jgi:hypothetical protein
MEDEEQNIHFKNLSVHRAATEEEALNLVRLITCQSAYSGPTQSVGVPFANLACASPCRCTNLAAAAMLNLVSVSVVVVLLMLPCSCFLVTPTAQSQRHP